MAVTWKFIDLDKYYEDVSGEKIILNDLPLDTDILNQTYTNYHSEEISTIPSCDCGYLRKTILEGQKCPECDSICTDPLKKVKPKLWLRALGPKYKFINPYFYTMLRQQLDKNVDVLRWLSDPTYNPPIASATGGNGSGYLSKLKDHIGGIRNYSNTMAKIPEIINWFCSVKHKEPTKRKKLMDTLNLYIEHKNTLFSTHLPIVNKKMFAMENTSKGKFINLVVGEAIDAVTAWVNRDVSHESHIKDSKATALAIHSMSNLYKNFVKGFVEKKKGLIRKHMYGGRIPFTFRNTIVSFMGKQIHDEIHVPWGSFVTGYQPHIMNLLVYRHGLSVYEAEKKLIRSVKNYDPLIDTCIKELIKDSKYKGLPTLAHRNPTLLQGSSQLVYITKVKTDPKDFTINISPLIIKAPNGDYDGDEFNITIIHDNELTEELLTLESYYNIPSNKKPFDISGNLNLLTPANSIVARFLVDEEENHGKETPTDMLKELTI